MQVRLITPKTPQFGARLSFDELESRSAERERLAAPLTKEAQDAAKKRAENARRASLVNAANNQARAEKEGRATIARLRKIIAQRRWKGTYKPRTNGIF